MKEIIRRVGMLLRRRHVEHELEEEMQLHVELRQNQFEGEGLAIADARAAAQRRFGNTLRLREEGLDAWGWRWLDDLAQDVRFGARALRNNRGFTAAAVLTLALATGATTAIFSIVNGVLLRPLPFPEADRLIQVYGTGPLGDTEAVSPIDAIEFKRNSTTIQQLAGYSLSTRHLEGNGGRLERLTTVFAERAFFPLLGVEAMIGRTFGTDDPPDVAVVSGRLWRQRFGSDPTLPGKVITLDGRRFTVIGVMSDTFQFPYGAASLMPGALPESRTDLWLPLDLPAGRPVRFSYVVGRLLPGATVAAAATEVAGVAQRLAAERPNPNVRPGARVVALTDVVIGPVQRSLWILFGAVGLVLAAACANVANLLLARMTARTGEVTIRAALGADRLRLVRQFLVESMLLSSIGGLGGLLIAWWMSRLLVSLGAAKIPRAHEIALDWQTFGFLLAACVAIAVLFGLIPVIAAAKVDLRAGVREASSQPTAGHTLARIRDGLVVAEVAFAFVLACGAAIVVQEAVRLKNVPTGMVTNNVLTLHLTPRTSAAEYAVIEQGVTALPGIVSAGVTQLVPLQNWGWPVDFSIRGRAPTTGPRPTAEARYVSPGYFQTLGIPLRRGRLFTNGDTAETDPVLLINETLARRYFPGEDPVGRALNRGTIVGVVGDVRQVNLDQPAEPELYYPAAQTMTMSSDIGMSLIVRTRNAPEASIAQVQSAVRAVNPALAIFNVKTMDEVLADSLWEVRLYGWLIGMFAALAVVLVTVGLYGVTAYNVQARLREFAVRLALGNTPQGLVRIVLTRGVRLAVVGLVLGGFAALMVGSSVNAVSAFGHATPVTYAVVAVLVLGVTLAACVVPATKVFRVSPASALRHQ